MNCEAVDLKKQVRQYFCDFLKKQGKGISNNEFEMLSQFENYIVDRLTKENQ